MDQRRIKIEKNSSWIKGEFLAGATTRGGGCHMQELAMVNFDIIKVSSISCIFAFSLYSVMN